VAKDLNIWRLRVRADKYLSLIPGDLNYFRSHFIGEPLQNWEPPPVTIAGRSKKLPDIVAWSVRAPVVSEKAANVLRSVLGTCAEFLPFHQIRGHVYFAMNVLCVERDLLDVERSDVKYAADGETVLALETAAFLQPLPHRPEPIFKIALEARRPFGDIFVGPPFCKAAIDNRLTGFELTNPAQSSASLSISGHSANVVPGIVG